jgi:hypothetical protein
MAANPPTVSEHQINGLRAVRLVTPDVRLDVLPELGGKTISLTDAITGHEYLSRPSSDAEYRLPAFGGAFEDYDISGWDECFPAIGESSHPDAPWRGTAIPDHGELWTLPWHLQAVDGTLRLGTHGVRFPYAFAKQIVPRAGGFRLDYRVENPTPFTFACFWSTHPLFAASPSTRVMIPTSKMRVQASISGRLGGLLDEHSWPATVGRDRQAIELDVIGPSGQGEADKLYSARVREGWAALHEEDSDQWLLFTFSPERVPFVGFWANRSGWPAARPSYNLALEPCNGAPDRLDLAVARGDATAVPAKGELTWSLNVQIGRGASALRRSISESGGTPP